MQELTAMTLLLLTKTSFSTPLDGSFRFANLEDTNPNTAGTYGEPKPQPVPTSGPYPPSGWTPSGDLLLLPGETHSSQQNQPNKYGAPPIPNNQYGPAESTTKPTSTTTTEPVQDPENSEGDSQIGTASNENGQYYVVLPGGKLQKVRYSGKQRGRGQYEAQVQYEEVDTARAPVYSYTYSNLPLQIPF